MSNRMVVRYELDGKSINGSWTVLVMSKGEILLELHSYNDNIHDAIDEILEHVDLESIPPGYTIIIQERS